MRKVFSLLLSTVLFFNQASFVWAYSIPTPPVKPTAPTAPVNPWEVTPTLTPTPTGQLQIEGEEGLEGESGITPAPTRVAKPTPPTKPTAPSEPESPEPSQAAQSQGETNDISGSQAVNSGNGSGSTNSSQTSEITNTNLNQKNNLQIGNDFQAGADTGGNFANYSAGGVEIITGDANVSLSLVNSGNQNTAVVSGNPAGSCGVSTSCGAGSSGSTSKNSQNGADSQNNTSSQTSQTTTIDSSNQAQIVNNFAGSSNTGGNKANYTTGGDAVITTGNANTVVNVVNFANTNGVEVAVKEFNILDDQTGDVTLDFSDAKKVSSQGDSGAVNSGNGAGSTNQSTIDDTGSIVVVNQNNGSVQNSLVVNADTGANSANFTTGGDSNIQTGDANVVVNVINFLNNNLTAVSEVMVGVVNIMGDWVGNIILPGDAQNVGNGAGSTNTASTNAQNSQTIVQSNTANIANTIQVDANTGGNKANYDTGGDVSLQTGDTTVKVNATTVANENVVAQGGDDTIFVVLVNEMGKWVGKILGAGNEGNGADSTNFSEVNSTAETTIVQENSAEVQNNIAISADTGKNSTSYNTDGNSTIETGDVNVLTNIVSFLNNNFVGKKLVISIVNVFGSWLGDIGSEKDLAAVALSTPTPTPTSIPEPEKATSIDNNTQQTQPEKVNEVLGDGSSQDNDVNNDLDNSQNSILPSLYSSPSTPSDTQEENNGNNNNDSFSQTDVSTFLDLAVKAGGGSVDLKEEISAEVQQKKTILAKKTTQVSQKVLAQKQTLPSPWANRNLRPGVSNEIEFEGTASASGLPWGLSSAILMIIGIITGILKRFLG